jgi:hypothetical protein
MNEKNVFIAEVDGQRRYLNSNGDFVPITHGEYLVRAEGPAGERIGTRINYAASPIAAAEEFAADFPATLFPDETQEADVLVLAATRDAMRFRIKKVVWPRYYGGFAGYTDIAPFEASPPINDAMK